MWLISYHKIMLFLLNFTTNDLHIYIYTYNWILVFMSNMLHKPAEELWFIFKSFIEVAGNIMSKGANDKQPRTAMLDHSMYVMFAACDNMMMTSSNGNIFRVTGPLCGEFTGPGEFPAQRPVTWSFDVFFDLCLNKQWVNNRETGDLRCHCAPYDFTVMFWEDISHKTCTNVSFACFVMVAVGFGIEYLWSFFSRLLGLYKIEINSKLEY